MSVSAYSVIVLGVAAKFSTAVGVGREMLTGPLPVPMGTEHTEREAFSPLPQYDVLPYVAATAACRKAQTYSQVLADTGRRSIQCCY